MSGAFICRTSNEMAETPKSTICHIYQHSHVIITSGHLNNLKIFSSKEIVQVQTRRTCMIRTT